jgi:hypothetical protein
MILSVWVLVIFMRWGHAGGTVTIDYSTKDTCQQALNYIKDSRNIETAFCIEKR